MAENYHFTPEDVGKLTMAQISVYATDISETGFGKSDGSQAGAAGASKRNKADRIQWQRNARNVLRVIYNG